MRRDGGPYIYSAFDTPARLHELVVTQAHREGLFAAEHSRPVDPLVDSGGEADDLRVVGEVARAVRTPQSSRDVDGEDLAIAPGLSGFDAVEVREETVMIGEGVAVESQRAAHLFENMRGGLIAAFLCDTEGRQPKKPVAAMCIRSGTSIKPRLRTPPSHGRCECGRTNASHGRYS